MLERERDLEAFGHSEIPFERVVERLAPVRSQTHTPLFQVAFSFEHRVSGAVDLPGLTVTPMPFETGIAQFDLALTLGESDDGLMGVLRYATDLFDGSTADAIAHRYMAVLAAVVADPSLRVDSVDLLADTERDALVPIHGPASAPFLSWAGLVSDATDANPDGVAVVWEGVSYTYREVDRAASRLAVVLAGRGARPETLIAVAIPRSVASVVAIWAVAKTGAGFVPVDPTYPVERIAHMLTDSGVTVGVTTADTVLPDTGVQWVLLDDLDTTAGAVFDPVPVRPEHPAYVIYTSGSTGRPKGVVVTNAGLANLAAERRSRYAITAATRFLHHTSISFDMAVGEQVSALSGAATLVIAPTGLLGTELTAFLVEERVSHALITPAVLATLDPAAVPELDVLGVGGEAVSADLVDRWAPGRAMRNGYGPTRGHRHRHRRRPVSGRARCRSGRWCTGSPPWCWTRGCGRSRPGWWASCIWPGPPWPAATTPSRA